MTLYDALAQAVKVVLDPLTPCDFCWHSAGCHKGGPCTVARIRFDGVKETCRCVRFETRLAAEIPPPARTPGA
jgi:hypothetical protein